MDKLINIVLVVVAVLVMMRLSAINVTLSDVKQDIKVVLHDNQQFSRSSKALKGTACAGCHLVPGNFLPKAYLSMEDFKDYVTGRKRFGTNTQMPNFDFMDDAELELLYKKIYMGD
jgi:cytochrome c553